VTLAIGIDREQLDLGQAASLWKQHAEWEHALKGNRDSRGIESPVPKFRHPVSGSTVGGQKTKVRETW
jgi:hypothetical protein